MSVHADRKKVDLIMRYMWGVNKISEIYSKWLLQAAASCYIELIVKESDNNVKLIVLDRLIALREVPAHEKVLQVIQALLNLCSNFITALMCIMNYASLTIYMV